MLTSLTLRSGDVAPLFSANSARCLGLVAAQTWPQGCHRGKQVHNCRQLPGVCRGAAAQPAVLPACVRPSRHLQNQAVSYVPRPARSQAGAFCAGSAACYLAQLPNHQAADTGACCCVLPGDCLLRCLCCLLLRAAAKHLGC